MKYRAFLVVLLLSLSLPSLAQNADFSMVFLGASNTNTVQWNNGSYVTKLRDFGDPWTELNITNAGEDGVGADTYANNEDLLSIRLLNYTTDFILIMLGGNDYLRQHSVQQFQQNLERLLSNITNRTEALVFVSNIIWSPLEAILSDSAIERYEAFQSTILNLSQKYNSNYVDVFNATDGHSEYYQLDTIHLNEAGHRAVAATIHNQTSAIIEQEMQRSSPEMSNNFGTILGILTIGVLISLIPIMRKYLSKTQ